MLDKINNKKTEILEILTIASYIVSIFIYEIFICNGETNGTYNFSPCRIAIYIVFICLLIKYLNKFIIVALETFKNKNKKVVFAIYILLSLLMMIYVLIKWTSIYRIAMLLISLLMGALFIVYVSANCIKNVIITICTFGIIFTVTTNINHGLDEKKHAMSAVNLAFGNFEYAKNPLNEPAFNNIIFNCKLSQFIKFFSQRYEPALTEEWGTTKDNELYYTSSTPADYNFILYIPSAMGMRLATMFGGSIADVYLVGRLFNLIAYGILIIITLKILPNKQKIFSMVYLLPISLVLSASYSIDGLCIGFIGIFIAYCLKLSQNYEKVKIKQIFILLGLFAMCLLAKNLAYFAVVVFVLTLPIIKILKNNKEKLPIIIAVLVGLAVICGGLLIYKLNTTVVNGEADIRGGNTNGKAQIEFLINNPLNIIKVFFNHIMNSVLNFHWYAQLNQDMFFGKYYEQIFFIQLIFILYVAITDNSKQCDFRIKISSILTFLAVFISTSLMLYINFTPVGDIGINGYQTRYILPILPILLMLINKKSYKYENNDISIYGGLGFLILIDIICAVYII